MDFARKQLEKYGWTDGKGLGKNENGISEPLKPKLKRSVAGIGHDAAADFTEHWWTQLYNKAAKNVEVLEKNGKMKKIKTKDKDGFEITNSTWKMNRKRKQKQDGDEGYTDYFVKKAVLANGGSKLERTTDSDSEEEALKKDVFKMTDEELFAACGGRTAHKGARHGLKATGKLARIAQQEEMLLRQSQYNGYSHTRNITNQDDVSMSEQVVEDSSLINENHSLKKNGKKKKKKRCISQTIAHCVEPSLPVEINKEISENIVIMDVDDRNSAKIKKTTKGKLNDNRDDVCTIKTKKRGIPSNIPPNNDETNDTHPETPLIKCKKKKKNK